MKVVMLVIDILITIVLVAIGNPVLMGIYLAGLLVGGVLKGD